MTTSAPRPREAAALVALCAAAYLPAWLAFFVKDDLVLITSARLDMALLHRAWPGGFFRPAAEALFAVEAGSFGIAPLPYHLVSFIAHLAAVWLGYRLMGLVPRCAPFRFGAAAVFALHPLCTETVSWISGQLSLAAALCTLATLYLLGRARPRAALAFFILGLGFYENFLLVIPLAAALWWREERFGPGRGPLFACGLATAAYLYWRFGVLDLAGGNYQLTLSPANALVNCAYYAYLLAGGSALGGRIARYRPEALGDHFFDVFTPLLIFHLGVGLCYLLYRRRDPSPHPGLVLPLAWVALALLPALVLPERPRRLGYLAVPGFALLLAQVADYLQQKTRPWLARAGLVVYAMLLVSTLYARNGDWRRAGAIERDLPRSIAGDCRQVTYDVPNLLGDALFFNSAAAEKWLGLSGLANPPAVHAATAIGHPPVPTGCHYRYLDGTIQPTAASTPVYTRGGNWAP